MVHTVSLAECRLQFMFPADYYFNFPRKVMDCSLIISKTNLCEALGVWGGSERGDQGKFPGK